MQSTPSLSEPSQRQRPIMTLDGHDIGLDAATSSLLDALSETPAQQLAVLLTQHGASLPIHTQRALHILACQAVNDLVPPQPGSASHADAERVVSVLRRLIARGDPSQARRLVPTSAALVDLALCCNDARDVLARLVDEQSAEALLRAAGMAYEQAETSRSPKQIARAAFVLARLLNSLPIWTHTSVSAGRKGLQQTSSRSAVYPTSKETMKLLSSLQRNYSSLDVKEPIASAAREHLLAKMAMLDAAWSLLERQSHSGFKASSVAEMDRLLHTAAASRTTSTPLVDLDLLADLALIKPSAIEMLRTSVPHSSSLGVLVQQVTRVKEASGAELGAGWSRVASLLRVPTQTEVVNPSQRGDDEHLELISMIVAILPQWEGRVPQLQATLREARFAGQSDDMIVQMLMDEGAAPATAGEETSDAMELLRQRANVFDDDDEALRKATLLRGGAKGKRRAQQDVELSEDIKAAILARANAPDSDEEDALGWNPFADEAALEVGFEEELGDDDEMHQASRNFLAPRRTAEEGSDTEEGEADGRHAGAGHGTRMYEPSPTASGSTTPTTITDASDRAAERVLIEAWKEGGELQFGKESRKSKARTELLARVNNVSTTKRWDDQLLESWATMFSRNPRKEKLLAAADDVLRFGNPNHRPVQLGDDKDGHEARGFGPDRGRGGRVYGPSRGTGGRGGERGGRGRGGGKSRGGRGGGARGQTRGGGGAAGGGGTRA